MKTVHAGTSTGTIELAQFTDSSAESASHYSATIHWGNGKATVGTIKLSHGVFIVDAADAYSAAGDYSPTIVIKKDSVTTATVKDSNRIDVLKLPSHIAAATPKSKTRKSLA